MRKDIIVIDDIMRKEWESHGCIRALVYWITAVFEQLWMFNGQDKDSTY